MSAGRAMAVALMLLGCDADPDRGEPDGGSTPPTPRVDYASDALYDAPWPDERLRTADGVDLSTFPNPRRVAIVEQLKTVLRDVDGFPTSSTIFFALDGAIDPESLPSVRGSLETDASVFVIDVDDGPERGSRHPIEVAFARDPGPFGARHLLAALPLQGRPLRADRTYAAVLTTRVRGTDGAPIPVARTTAAMIAGERPNGLGDRAWEMHRGALETLIALGIEPGSIAATAVFRTDDPTAELFRAREEIAARPLPVPVSWERTESFDDFCVLHATVQMPDFQGGEPPFNTEGGGWVRGADGRLSVQREALANLWLTVPRTPMPVGGYPTAVFVRTGGGGDRPLVDRGPRATPGGMAIEPGTGPAMHFARVGFAGLSVDGPLGGLRNFDGWDEQFAIFNIDNPPALRDAIRQSALELAIVAQLATNLAPTVSCDDGPADVRVDGSRLAIVGHSMGATIAPLAVAIEPSYRAMILSGAGASWIENVVYKESPIVAREAAEGLLGYLAQNRELTVHDPVLALLQWAGEPADPQMYARSIIDAPAAIGPRHVLMFQGILDTYIPPPVANSLSLALGLDLAGDDLDRDLEQYAPLSEFLDLAGRRRIDLPVEANRGEVTAVVVQHLEDGIEDGHEVMFQTPAPQLQVRCFLESYARGTPRVPASDATDCR